MTESSKRQMIAELGEGYYKRDICDKLMIKYGLYLVEFIQIVRDTDEYLKFNQTFSKPIPNLRHHWTDENNIKIVDMYNRGKTYAEIAEVMEASTSCIAVQISAIKRSGKYTLKKWDQFGKIPRRNK